MPSHPVLRLVDGWSSAHGDGAELVRVVEDCNVTSAIRRATLVCDDGVLPTATALTVELAGADGGQISGVARTRRRSARSLEVVVDYADPRPGQTSTAHDVARSHRLRVVAASAIAPLPQGFRQHVLVGDESALPLLAARARSAPVKTRVLSLVRVGWSDTWDYVDPDGVPVDASWWPSRPSDEDMSRIAESVSSLVGPVSFWTSGGAEQLDDLTRLLKDLAMESEPRGVLLSDQSDIFAEFKVG